MLWYIGAGDDEEPVAALKRFEAQVLERMEPYRKAGDVSFKVLNGRPADALADEAAANGYDAIAIASCPAPLGSCRRVSPVLRSPHQVAVTARNHRRSCRCRV